MADEIRKAPRKNSLEVSFWHLPIIPVYTALRKVKGYVDEFTKLREG